MSSRIWEKRIREARDRWNAHHGRFRTCIAWVRIKNCFLHGKDRALHFFAASRKLDAVTISNSYLVSSMDEWIDLSGNETIFFPLEESRSYWQVTVSKEDCDKTAFVSQHSECFTFLANAIWIEESARDVPTSWKSFTYESQILVCNALTWRHRNIFATLLVTDEHIDDDWQSLTLH